MTLQSIDREEIPQCIMRQRLKVYKTMVSSVLLFGAETWATEKRQETRIEVILGWMC